jgi:hypothetical protein
MKPHRLLLLLLLALIAGCCSSCGVFGGDDKLPADEVGQAAFLAKQNIEVAKRNRDKALDTYDAELRRRYEAEWKLYFANELKVLEANQKMTPAQVTGLYDFVENERKTVFGMLDQKLAQWKADDTLDQCAALADIQIMFARQVSETQRKFHELVGAVEGAASRRTTTP